MRKAETALLEAKRAPDPHPVGSAAKK